jgi:hypothetical protein
MAFIRDCKSSHQKRAYNATRSWGFHPYPCPYRLQQHACLTITCKRRYKPPKPQPNNPANKPRKRTIPLPRDNDNPENTRHQLPTYPAAPRQNRPKTPS